MQRTKNKLKAGDTGLFPSIVPRKAIAGLFALICFIPQVPAQHKTVGLIQHQEEAFPGYTLFGNNETTYLIDNCGRMVNEWVSAYKPGNGMYLLENGHLLRSGRIDKHFDAGGIGGIFELFDWDGQLLWSFELAGPDLHAHHDLAPLPNGNFLALAWERIPATLAREAGRKYDGEVWSEAILEIEIDAGNNANIVWEWHLMDHVIQDHDPMADHFGTVQAHPELLDINYIGPGQPTSGNWIHANAIDYNVDLDQIAISSRMLSEVWIIDHGTSTAEAAGHNGGRYGKGGDFLYRFGHPDTYGYDTLDIPIFRNQHDVRWIPQDHPHGGSLMVFNNNFGQKVSRVEVWDPPTTTDGKYTVGSDGTFGPDQLSWTYEAAGFYSPILSSAQMLPNGNVLICEGVPGRFLEVTPDKRIVWEYINPVNRNGAPAPQGSEPRLNQTFRATRYAMDYPAFNDEKLRPGAPVEINPWPDDCETADPTVTGPTREDRQNVNVYPNPSKRYVKIEGIETETFHVSLSDLYGRICEWTGNLSTIDLVELSPGIYRITIQEDGRSEAIRMKLVKQ